MIFDINYKSEIRDLIDTLNLYTKYYDEGNPKISDTEWDNLYFKLVALENKYNVYFEDSPTQRINYQVVNKLNKVEHSHPMLSLDKTKSIDAIKSFIGNKDYIAMAKMDGLTCSLTYENGKLVKAETRGNGLIGEDILHNALQVKNIPNKINYKNKLVVDGEIICTYNNFKNFESEYKNPRNFASGSIRLLDSKESAMRNLTFIAWDLIEGFTDNEFLSTRLIELKNIGFTIVPFYCNREIEESINLIKKDCEILEYPIDGLVFKYDLVEEYNMAGRTDHHFKGGLAYKFYDEEYETTLKDIEWTMGRTGQLTPVAIYDDIDIDGAICNRASLHNITILKDTLNGYGWEGQEIKIYKANQIIPQISWSQPENEFNKKYFHYPMTCPICNAPTEIRKDVVSEVLYCSNPNCQGKLINIIDHFCSKKGLDIKGLSKATLEKLINWGWINSVSDIYKLQQWKKEWENKPGFGTKSVSNILQSISESTNCNLESVISAAGIPLIGRTVAKDISARFPTYNQFREAVKGNFDFSELNNFGYEMNKSLKNFDYTELDYIVENFLTIKENKQEDKQQKLKGLTFCITGKLINKDKWKNRDELSTFIISLGGKVVGAVSPHIDYLINNDINSTSTKNNRAKELGKQIIDEQTFIDMFDL